MLKQFSAPKKVFGIITLLSSICYVGVMVYVEQAFADNGSEHWVRYHAMVDNITKNGDTFAVRTIHKLRYHNHHNHTFVSPNQDDRKMLRTGNQWGDVTPGTPNSLLTKEKNTHITMVRGYGTFTVTRSEQWESEDDNLYQASAYTNLWSTDGWDNDGGVFDQIEAFTAKFPADEFGSGNPPLPTADPAQISSHPDD